jgi:hypothetical protein
MDGNKENLELLCCFCNKKIESSNVNPADLNIQINWDKSKDMQYNQTFFCHIECFKEKLHDSIKNSLYLSSILGD